MGGWGAIDTTLMYPDLWHSFPIRRYSGSHIALLKPRDPMERARFLSRLEALLRADLLVDGVQLELGLEYAE